MMILETYTVYDGRAVHIVSCDRDLKNHHELNGSVVRLDGMDFMVTNTETYFKAIPPRKGEKIGLMGAWL